MKFQKTLVACATICLTFAGMPLASGQSGPVSGSATVLRPHAVTAQALSAEFAQIAAMAARSKVSEAGRTAASATGAPRLYNQFQKASALQTSAACSTPGDACTSNWSGLEAYGDNFAGVVANWTVPSVSPTSSAPEDSATWIGLDGDPYYDNSANPPLIQIGTDSPTNFPGEPSVYYEAWVEMLPGAEQPLFAVNPGDVMQAEIYEPSPGLWDLAIKDTTTGQAWTDSSVPYNAPGATAEWIQEATTLCFTGSPCATSQLQDFGTVSFTNWSYYDYGAGSAYGQSDYMVDQYGNVIASPTWDAQSISVTYNGPSQPALAGWTEVTPPSGLYVGDGQDGPPTSPVSCAPGTTHCVAVLASTSVTTGTGLIGQGVAVTSDLTHWAYYNSLPSQFNQLLSISCPTATQCAAVGTSTTDAPVVALSTDGGVSWTEANLSAFTGAPGWSQAIDCPSALVCYTVGGSQGPFAPMVAKSTDGGQDWALLDSHLPALAGFDLNAISCSSTSTCVAVGALSSTGPAIAITTTDGGSTWAQSSASALAGFGDMASVSCPPGTSVCYAGTMHLGVGGPVLAVSQDSGASWRSISIPVGNGWISSVSCANALTCWAAGAGTTLSLAGTGDGGATFQEDLGNTTNQLSNVSCASDQVCIATTDNALWSTTDNGGVTPGQPGQTTTTTTPTSTSTSTTSTSTSTTSTSTSTTSTSTSTTSASTTTTLTATPPAGGGGGAGGGVPPASLTTTSSSTTTTTGATTTTTVATRATNGTTTTTPAPPIPHIAIVSSSATVLDGYLPIKLSCQDAACSGHVEVIGVVAVKVRKGKKTTSENNTVVFGNARYSIGEGKRATVEVKLDSAGEGRFAHAKTDPVKAHAYVTVRGGTAATKVVKIS